MKGGGTQGRGQGRIGNGSAAGGERRRSGSRNGAKPKDGAPSAHPRVSNANRAAGGGGTRQAGPDASRGARPAGGTAGSGTGGSAAPPGSGNGGRNAKAARQRQPGAAGASRAVSARELAWRTLVKVAESGAYSNLQLNRALEEAQLPRADAALATELVYGTIQRQRTLDYRLASLVAKGLDKLEPWVLQLLRMSAYQLLYLDRVPAHAAVNEAVTIAKRRGHAGISGMVNGVLRSMERRRAEMAAPVAEPDPVRQLGIAYSYPDWLVERWVREYGAEGAEAICAAGNEAPRPSLRVNRLKGSREEALAALAAAGIGAEPSRLAPQGIVAAAGAGNLAATEGYRAGRWSLQDESSMLVAEVCAPEPGMTALDCCAAPGGKAAHLAELMEDRGRIVANDLHPHKRKLIEDQAQRLGLASIEAVTGDAVELTRRFPAGSFDLVLLDAPCSGFGVIRRKPEIRWTKSPEDIRAIAGVQRKLLDEAAALVKPGGTLVYSTCTIGPEENEEQIADFLKRNGAFRLDAGWPEAVLAPLREAGVVGERFAGSAQLLPQHFGSDGFFIARLRRTN